MDVLKIVPANQEKHSELIKQMFVDQFSQQEPMAKAAGATPEDMKVVYTDTVEYCLNEPYSFVAYIGKNCIGFCLNYIEEFGKGSKHSHQDPNLKFNGDLTKRIANLKLKGSKTFKKINCVITEIERNYTYFMPNCKKVFRFSACFVDSDYAGNGYGSKLFQKSLEIALENRCDYLMTTVSAGASYKICIKAGLDPVREIPFAEFVQNGENIFQELHDRNDTIKLMVLKLDSAPKVNDFY